MKPGIWNPQSVIIENCQALAAYAGGPDQLYTVEFGTKFAAMTTSPWTGKFSAVRRFDYTRFVNIGNSYVETGVVSLAVTKRGGGGPRPVCSEFVVLNTVWEHDMAPRGLATQTQDYYGRLARSYLVCLEDQGIVSLTFAEMLSDICTPQLVRCGSSEFALYKILGSDQVFSVDITFPRASNSPDAGSWHHQRNLVTPHRDA